MLRTLGIYVCVCVFVLAVFSSGLGKKDICFVAQNLTGVKEILGKRHTDLFSAAYQRREKMKR